MRRKLYNRVYPRLDRGLVRHCHLTSGRVRMWKSGASILAVLSVFLMAQTSGRVRSRYDSTTEDLDDLKILIVVWRHGDRAPVSTYPNDPYRYYQYLPEGKGNLNYAGKKRSYDLGGFLRKRYCDFLGSERLPNTTVLRSTYVPRALESGALVLAALYPPAADQKWASELGQLWTPVAFTSVPADEDNLLNPEITSECLAYLVDVLLAEEELKEEIYQLTDNGTLLDYIANQTGLNASDYTDIFGVSDTLTCQLSCGLTLPNWTASVYPEPLVSIWNVEYKALVYTHRQRRLSGGVFLENVRVIAQSYLNSTLPEGRKFFGYSAHDNTLTAILAALGVWNEQQPPFASAILIELHETNNTLGLKVLYHNDTSTEPYELTLPGCDLICPLDDFIELYEDIFLTSEEQKELCITGD